MDGHQGRKAGVGIEWDLNWKEIQKRGNPEKRKSGCVSN